MQDLIPLSCLVFRLSAADCLGACLGAAAASMIGKGK
jgi:hypothetical protein